MIQTQEYQINNLKTIANFIDRYNDFSKHIERQKIAHYKTKFDGLISGYESLRDIIATFNKREAVEFNIFDILNIKMAEVKTHTPLLKNLLNPNGSHAQSDLFLKSFIQQFIPENKRDFFILSDKNDYNIEEEKLIQNGRIDIYLQSINSKKNFSLVIENKLFANDQYLQLNRYYDFLKERKYEDHQLMMFYLTIDGNDPSSYSINKDLMTELKKRNILCNLSYKKDINNWLTSLQNEIKAKNVKHIVNQYLETINQF